MIDATGGAGRPRVRLHVFSITVDWPGLEAELKMVGAGETVGVLTPHQLLPVERARLDRGCAGEVVTRTYHDLLDVADMEFCDEEADRLTVAEHGAREGRVGEYYAAILRLKNERAAERLRAEFDVAGGAVWSGDLGIEPAVWLGLGLDDRRPPPARPPVSAWGRLRRALGEPAGCHWLEWRGERWLLVGRRERVAQYLDRAAVSWRPAGRFATWWFHLEMFLVLRLPLPVGVVRAGLRVLNAPWARRFRGARGLAATVHEDNVAVARLAESLGLDYVNLQDSFLPAYYPSRYLRYRPAVRRFLVWDEFSHGIFRRHGLSSERWGAYRSWSLPMLAAGAAGPVRRLVYLCSGAGDWTALKNRSDEDRALLLLAEVARRRPDVEIRYRPHPLWLHPEHQGLNSIDRVVAGVAALALPNLGVSQSVRRDGRRFTLDGNLSAVSSSMEEDIDWADLVLGEHSQTILVAAQRGKLIAGLHVAKHPGFFADYARLGFPRVTTPEELETLIDRAGTVGADGGFRADYNRTIARHNRENCGREEHPA